MPSFSESVKAKDYGIDAEWDVEHVGDGHDHRLFGSGRNIYQYKMRILSNRDRLMEREELREKLDALSRQKVAAKEGLNALAERRRKVHEIDLSRAKILTHYWGAAPEALEKADGKKRRTVYNTLDHRLACKSQGRSDQDNVQRTGRRRGLSQRRNANKMMQQVQKMQQEMQRAQEELARETVTASAGGGAVKATMTGGLELVSIEIDPEVVDPEDVEMLQDMVLAAVNEALSSAQDLASKKLGGVTGGLGDLGLNLPGL